MSGFSIRLWAEMLLLYAIAPIGAWYLVAYYDVSLFTVLFPAAVVLSLLITLRYGWKHSVGPWRWRDIQGDLRKVLGLFVLMIPVLSAVAFLLLPSDQWLFFVQDPGRLPMLLLIWVFYPVVSVLSQEIIFRLWFRLRYQSLFSRPWVGMLVQAGAFSFGHIVMQNPVAVWGTIPLGLLLAYRSYTTRSSTVTFVEHTLYGNLAFFLGMGYFFYSGVR